MPFGITNGVACFQRSMDGFITDYDLKETYAYMDNLTVGGRNKSDHDNNLEKFMKAAELKA